MAPEPAQTVTSPQTIWECSLVWADLLIARHVEALERSRSGRFALSEEETALYVGVDGSLVCFVIAAALHERIVRLELSFPDAIFVPLAAAGEEGATGTLRRSAFSALELSPDLDDWGGAARALLIRTALSAHPDERLLWDRVRSAALRVVDAVASSTPAQHTGHRHPDVQEDGPYWERGITVGDVILGEQRRRELEHLVGWDEDGY
ncbi:hypothetical protein [Streptacidiphilus fuscans]|uniref:Uncharacterized protein n=1 Tax=Streptacidiphilus fuscans TaxID=2789292 RepID=A0A931FHH5_9ACTN|nr:hypothetical protein [Streptacidiphilus fuscans]MBF9071841.1 hypothetical protein [Streptacidiphilus fuscans]